jgi:hypothetical protein
MTVSSDISRKEYAGDDSTVAFPTTFKFLATADIEVIIQDAAGIETLQAETTHYAVTGAGDDAGGTVTMITAPASGEVLALKRITTITQETDYVENDPFPAETHEAALDRLTLVAQEVSQAIRRAISAPVSDTDPDLELPVASLRANMFLVFDANGHVSISTGTGADAGLRGDLGSTDTSKGAELVGFKRTEFATADRTAQDKFIEMVSVSDFDSPQEAIDNVPEGTGIHFPLASYNLTAALNITRSVSLYTNNIGRGFTRLIQGTPTEHVVTINPTVNGKIIKLDGFALEGGTNGLNVVGPPVDGTKHIHGSSLFKNLEITGQSGKGINITASVIGTRWESINCENMGSYGIYAAGLSILNATQWQGIRVQGASVTGLHIEHTNDTSDQTSIHFANLTCESNPGKGVVVNKSQVLFTNAHFEQNGSSSGEADVELTGGSAIRARATLHGGYFGSPSAAQSNRRVLFTSNQISLGISRMRFSSSQTIDAANFATGVSIVLIDNDTQPSVVNYPGVNLVDLTSSSLSVTSQFISTRATSAGPPLAITSTKPVANLTAEPVVYNNAGTQQVNQHCVAGLISLVAGAATLTLSGDAVFSSGSSYVCTANDQSAANPVRVQQVSGTQIDFTGTGTDAIRYFCIGN